MFHLLFFRFPCALIVSIKAEKYTTVLYYFASVFFFEVVLLADFAGAFAAVFGADFGAAFAADAFVV